MRIHMERLAVCIRHGEHLRLCQCDTVYVSVTQGACDAGCHMHRARVCQCDIECVSVTQGVSPSTVGQAQGRL